MLHRVLSAADYITRNQLIIDLLRYDNFVVSFTESCPQRIT